MFTTELVKDKEICSIARCCAVCLRLLVPRKQAWGYVPERKRPMKWLTCLLAAWNTVSKDTGVTLTNMNGGSALNYLLLVGLNGDRAPLH